ncbi:MAG TPA: prolyl oligopeptidase family serine peptidase [Beutenbergiaceae bacterium]|nr:prolyl oligopeptidase family serine peptidase [Beutenbergiaceae bacterium]
MGIRAPEPAGTYPPPRWEQRFAAGQVGLPEWAARAPDRAVVIASSAGTLQVHSFHADTADLVRATHRPAGTTRATIDPTGQWVWWFDDTAGNQFGVWRRQPFGSTAQRRPEQPIELPAAYDAGLLLGADGTAIVGRSDPRFGTQIHQVLVGAAGYGSTAPVPLYAHRQVARAAALASGGDLVAITHSERGDALHPAVRVVRGDTGTVVGDLDDGPGRGLWPQGFAPIARDTRLLVRHERTGHPALLLWDVATSYVRPLELEVPGDVARAVWTPDGRALLVTVDHHARTLLYRYGLAEGTTELVGPTTGTVTQATARPYGDAWVRWSSAAQPPTVIDLSSGRELLQIGTRAPESVPTEDVWADGPSGKVHALLRRPPGTAPYPLIVRLHDGPHTRDADVFDAEAAAWVDHGVAVLHVNFRGSTGYGNAWREELGGQVGFAELADVAAVHDHLIADGVADPERSVLSGVGRGGYLTLLGLGTQPERWALGVAVAPVADTVTAYGQGSALSQAQDRARFGGTPQQVPGAYQKASPLSYVDQVRAPLLVLAAQGEQIHGYVEALRAAGGSVRTGVDQGSVRTGVDQGSRRTGVDDGIGTGVNAGHELNVAADRIRRMRLQLQFVHEHVSRL